MSADMSIIVVCRLVFILIFVLILFVVCISTTDRGLDLYYYANIFIRVCISKHGCTNIGTNPSLSA